MPFASSDGARIYYTVHGEGPPLVLHPGFFGAAEDWVEAGYVAALRDRYRLIALDPRGQGRSDAPHEPEAYTVGKRVGDVLAVLDAERVERAHFWGYSMGGGLGLAVGLRAPERVRSLILGAGHPYRVSPGPDGVDPMTEELRAGMAALVREMEAGKPDFWHAPAERKRWLALDAEALIAARAMRLREPCIAEGDAGRIATPALLYAGTGDPMASVDLLERVAEEMPRATIVRLDGLDHAQIFARSELVLPHALAFLARVDAARPAG